MAAKNDSALTKVDQHAPSLAGSVAEVICGDDIRLKIRLQNIASTANLGVKVRKYMILSLPLIVEDPGRAQRHWDDLLTRAFFNSSILQIDLKKVALKCRNTEFNPRRFGAVIMRVSSSLREEDRNPVLRMRPVNACF